MLPIDEFRLYRRWKDKKGIEVVPILQRLWQRRWFLGKVAVAAVVVGIMYSFLAPSRFTSSATLMPEYSSQSQSMGRAGQLLEQYGGMLGISGGTYTSNSNAIRVELYPDIVQSLPFQMGLLKHEYYYPKHDTTASLKTYLMQFNKPTYLGSLPGDIFSSDAGTNPVDSKVDLEWTDVDILNLSEKELELLEYMRKRTSASLNQESAMLNIQAVMPEPQLSAKVAQQIINQLREYVKEYRREKLKMDLNYLQKQHKQAERRMEELRDSLAEFRDSHSNIVTASASIKEQRLQNKLDRASSLYKGLVRQLEQTRMKIGETPPVFQILQPVQVPLEASGPGRLTIMLISLFIGVLGGAGYLIFRNWSSAMQEKERGHEGG